MYASARVVRSADQSRPATPCGVGPRSATPKYLEVKIRPTIPEPITRRLETTIESRRRRTPTTHCRPTEVTVASPLRAQAWCARRSPSRRKPRGRPMPFRHRRTRTASEPNRRRSRSHRRDRPLRHRAVTIRRQDVLQPREANTSTLPSLRSTRYPLTPSLTYSALPTVRGPPPADARHRLQPSKPKPFLERGLQEDRAAGQQSRQLGRGYILSHRDPVPHRARRKLRHQACRQRTLPASNRRLSSPVPATNRS